MTLTPVPSALAKRFPGAQPFAVGSTGSLYRVAHGLLLKVFARGGAPSPAEAARLKRELQKQVQLQIAGLPKVVEYGNDESGSWLLREYVAGEPLSARLKRAGTGSVAEALAVAAQLASAVDDLHRAGLLHRDIKLGHILLNGDVVQLIDAGVVSLPADPTLAASYFAPELRAGKPVTFRADLYSVGCVLHRLLTGADYDYDGASPVATDAEWPKPVAQLLRSLLAEDPRQRPFSAQQVRRALDPFLPELARRTPTVAPSSRPAPAPADKTQEIALVDLESADRSDPTQEIELADLDAEARVASPRQPSAAGSKRPGKKPTSAPPPPPSLATLPPAAAVGSAAEPRELADLPELAEFPELAGPAASVEPDSASSASLAAVPTPVQPQPGAARVRLARAGAEIAAALRRAIPASTAPEPSAPSDLELPEVISKARRLGEVLRAKAAEREERTREAVQQGAPPPAAPVVDGKSPPSEVSSDVEIAQPRADDRPRAESEISSDVEIPSTRAAAGEVSSDVVVAKFEAPVPAPSTAPEPSARSKPAFDVDSLFDDELQPERSPAAGRAVPPPEVEREVEPVTVPEPVSVPDPEPRPVPVGRRPGQHTWPFLAAAGMLGVVVLGFAARACDPGDRHLADVDRQSEPPAAAQGAETSPPAPSAPAPSATAIAVNATAATAPEGAPAELPRGASTPDPAAAAPAEADPPAAAIAAPAREESRTLTAAQARPLPGSMRGGVVQYQPNAEPTVDHKARGRELFSAGKYREAADAYQQASVRTPSDAAAFAGLGASWLAAGNAERAIAAYQRALQLSPKISGFQAALGRAYLQKGDRPRAVAAYRKALELDPQNSAAKTGLKGLH